MAGMNALVGDLQRMNYQDDMATIRRATQIAGLAIATIAYNAIEEYAVRRKRKKSVERYTGPVANPGLSGSKALTLYNGTTGQSMSLVPLYTPSERVVTQRYVPGKPIYRGSSIRGMGRGDPRDVVGFERGTYETEYSYTQGGEEIVTDAQMYDLTAATEPGIDYTTTHQLIKLVKPMLRYTKSGKPVVQVAFVHGAEIHAQPTVTTVQASLDPVTGGQIDATIANYKIGVLYRSVVAAGGEESDFNETINQIWPFEHIYLCYPTTAVLNLHWDVHFISVAHFWDLLLTKYHFDISTWLPFNLSATASREHPYLIPQVLHLGSTHPSVSLED